jgi:50S ribosomal subunit-associated GTPase HflX
MTVPNKLDLLDDGKRKMEDGDFETPAWAEGGIAISAAKGWGLDELRVRIERALGEVSA